MNSDNPFDEIIGKHSSINEVKKLAARIAKSPCDTILIFGETGTGKELLAHAIHQASRRSDGPFIEINCAAIPVHLMESELFGHEKGSFTDAFRQKQGIVELANKGTLFLDEISEMDLSSQAKLLKMLDSRSFRRLGGVNLIDVDVRVVAASNKNLLNKVRNHEFREDLYYRLQVVSINLPPLRERGKDVLLLADSFIKSFNQLYQMHIQGIDPQVEAILLSYHWPGNVRELMNLLKRIFFTVDTDLVCAPHLPERIIRGAAQPAMRFEDKSMQAYLKMPFHEKTAEFQRQLIQLGLAKFNGNLTRTAEFLKLSRHALRHQMVKLGIKETATAPDPVKDE